MNFIWKFIQIKLIWFEYVTHTKQEKILRTHIKVNNMKENYQFTFNFSR